ncbi:hypothetical protein HPG69_007245 [Diceros bicornis minor]|uniref:C2H2-type domain-containing protein n=1 Tax=Diceros bicornis minor TaxID=77932 RepID=A0A7J7FN50_DICBM|nr:hypothetical protein HPG69_007245 [Diceros bicornis minor]
MAAMWAKVNELWITFRRSNLLVMVVKLLGYQEEGEVRDSGLDLLSVYLGDGIGLHKESPVLLSSSIFNLNQLPGPADNPMDWFLGCWHGAADEEVPAKQSISVEGVSQVRTPKAGVSPQKAHSCEICDPDLRDILHLSEHQETHCGQKLYRIGACEKQLCFSAKPQPQKQHTGETCFRSNVGRASFVKDCKFCVSGKPFSCEEVVRDIVASLRFLQHQATHTREKSNRRTECGAAFYGGNTEYNFGECTKAFDCKHILVQPQRCCELAETSQCPWSLQLPGGGDISGKWMFNLVVFKSLVMRNPMSRRIKQMKCEPELCSGLMLEKTQHGQEVLPNFPTSKGLPRHMDFAARHKRGLVHVPSERLLFSVLLVLVVVWTKPELLSTCLTGV